LEGDVPSISPVVLLAEQLAASGALTSTSTSELAGPLDTLYAKVTGVLGEQKVVVLVSGWMLTTGWVLTVTLAAALAIASQPAVERALAVRVTLKLEVKSVHDTVTAWEELLGPAVVTVGAAATACWH
jgi:hypothetical protein